MHVASGAVADTTKRLQVEVPDLPSSGGDRYAEVVRSFGLVAGALSQLRGLDDLLHLIASEICRLADAPRASVYLRDDKTGLYRGQVGHADHDIDAGIKRLVCGIEADRFTREIVATKAPVVVANTLTDTRPIRSAMRSWKVRSMMGVPMILREEVIGLVFLDCEDKRHVFSDSDRNIATAFAGLAAVAISQAQLTSELRSSLETVAKQNRTLRRAAAVDDRLTNLVLEGGNLRQTATAVAELTGKPCAIYDAEQTQRAIGHPPDTDDPIALRLLEPEFREHPQVAEALAALSERRSAVIGPFPAAGLGNRFLIAPVTVRDEQWGTLVIMEHRGFLSSFDMLVSRRAATIVALEISAERRAVSAEWNARAALAGELVRGNCDMAELERRAMFLGVDLEKPRLLCLVTAADKNVMLPDARTVVDAVTSALPGGGALATGVVDGVAALIEAPENTAPLEASSIVKRAVSQACASLADDGRLVAGVSTICLHASDYARAYVQARQVTQCIASFCPPDGERVLSADDLGAARVLLASSDVSETERFAQETLGGLLQDDQSRDLLDTLEGFFLNGRSVRRSAEHVGVHENTIRYRLARIEQLTGLRVGSDSDAQLSAHLALQVIRLRGGLRRRRRLESSQPPPGVSSPSRSQLAVLPDA
jgi:sugar diacid utilization regulator